MAICARVAGDAPGCGASAQSCAFGADGASRAFPSLAGGHDHAHVGDRKGAGTSLWAAGEAVVARAVGDAFAAVDLRFAGANGIRGQSA